MRLNATLGFCQDCDWKRKCTFMNNDVSSPQGNLARLIVLGGFPGAGKTTAGIELAKFLKHHGIHPAVITNDHGSELVDTALFRAEGIFAEEIAAGDLCTRAAETIRLIPRLRTEQKAKVIIAEAAGTCASLSGTLLGPARAALSGSFSVAPLSVLVDPVRSSRVLKLEPGGKLTAQIAGFYRHQLEEAEILVINKADEIPAQKLPALRQSLSELNPRAKIFSVSAKMRVGLEEWFDCLMSKETAAASDRRPAVALETPLGWLNCSVGISSVKYFDAGKLLIDLASCVQSMLQNEGSEIAHLKMTFNPAVDGSGIAAVSIDRTDASPQLLRDISEPIQRGELLLNARALGDPEILHSVINSSLLILMERSPELFARMRHSEHFDAGRTWNGAATASVLAG